MYKFLFVLGMIMLGATALHAQTAVASQDPEFMLLFRNKTLPDGYALTPEDQAKAMPLWGNWLGNLAQKGHLVSTSPLMYEGHVVDRAGVKTGPVKSETVAVVGYVILRAKNADEAVALSRSCPIVTDYEGSVEVRPIQPFKM